MAEVERALQIARRIPMKVFVVHLGWPRTHKGFGGSNRDAARRSLETLFEIAEPLGVRLAVEVIPNDLSRAGSLVHLAEEDLESAEIGICLDFGHAHLDGDLVDAIEIVSGHLASLHVHDNRGRADDHLVPFEGTIDWPAARDGAAEGRLRRRPDLRGRVARPGQGHARARRAHALRRIENMLKAGAGR